MLGLYRTLSRLFPFKPPTLPPEPYIWFHGASLGEHKALGPLIKLFKEEGFPTLLTATAPSALSFAQQFSDNPSFVHEALRGALAVVVAEAELWPNLLLEAQRQGVPVFLVNGRVGRGTGRWARWAPGALRRLLGCFVKIFPKSPGHKEAFLALGAEPEVLGEPGDLKADALAEVEPFKPQELGLSPEKPVVVLGNLRPGEFEAAARVAEALAREAQIVLAPRHLEALPQLLRTLKVPHSLRSQGGGGPVLVLDTYGELRRVWGLARAAFVGGTLAPFGGHDLLEPASAGVPVAFGPHTENQSEAAEGLLRAGGGFRVKNEEELVEFFKRMLSDPQAQREAGERAREFFQSQRGTAKRVFREILRLISPRQEGLA